VCIAECRSVRVIRVLDASRTWIVLLQLRAQATIQPAGSGEVVRRLRLRRD